MERRLTSGNYTNLEYDNSSIVKETVINFKRRKLSGYDENEANVILLDDGTALEPETIEIAEEQLEEDNVELQEGHQILAEMVELDDQGEYVLQASEFVAEELTEGQHPLDDLELEEGEIRGANIGFVKPKYNNENVKVYLCPLCEKTFSQKGNLMRHYHSHTGTKPFSCDLCGHKFTQKSNLQKHIATHNGDKRFECGVCFKGFVQKANLIRHLRIHTGEKPFECQLCGHKFTQKGNLNKHMQLHNSSGDVDCEYCSTKFASYGAKLRHEKSVHGSNTTNRWQQETEDEIVIHSDFNCDECPAQFKSHKALKKHKKFHQ